MERRVLKFQTHNAGCEVELPVCAPDKETRTARVPKWLYEFLERNGVVYWQGHWEPVHTLSFSSRPTIFWEHYQTRSCG